MSAACGLYRKPILNFASVDRYMLRYLRCVQKMKQIIATNNLTVMGTIARYVSLARCYKFKANQLTESCPRSQACAYEAIAKPAWWNKAIDMGPVIEQGESISYGYGMDGC